MITESFAQFLTGNPAITAATRTIRPVVLPSDRTDPAMTYALLADDTERTLDGRSSISRAEFAIYCYSASYETVRSLAITIHDELEDYTGAMGDYFAQQVDMDRDVDSYENQTKLYETAITIEIWYGEEE